MDYLLFLQNLRESSLAWLSPVFVLISEGTITIGPLLAAVAFMCIDKKWGAKLLFNLCSGDFIMNNIKVTACVYRPWVRDSRLHVAEEVEETASGYSFPSGHTTAAATVYGTVALWQKAKKWLLAIMIILIALTLFARNWLGAHTLTDVSVAVIIGIITIALTQYVTGILEKDEKKDIWILAVVQILCVLSAIYITFKNYPMDYLADGSLLVDPLKMAEDTWAAIGMLSAWTLCWYIERRYIRMSIEGTVPVRIIRGIVIVIAFFICYKVVFKQLSLLIGGGIGAFLRRFLSVIVVCMFIPWCISKLQKRRDK